MSNVPVPTGTLAPPTAPVRPKVFVTTQRQVDLYLKDKRVTGAILRRTETQGRCVLGGFVGVCPEDASKISRRDVVRWLKTTGHLAQGSRRHYFSIVRGFTSHLLRRGVLTRDPFLDIPFPKVARAVHRSLGPDQTAALLAACITGRERVIVILGLHTGLRRAELAALEVGDINLSTRTVFVRHGKGGHERMVPLSVEAGRVVGHYLASEGLANGPLIRSVTCPQKGIGPTRLGDIFSTLAYRAGVKIRARDGVGTHSTRHTFATDVYEATDDVLAVRDLLGHQSLATTQVYVRGMNVERLRSAVEGRTYLPGSERRKDPS